MQKYCRDAGERGLLQEICEVALREYRRHEAWPLVVSTLQLLIEGCSENGDMAGARLYERELLDDIPPDRLPADFKWQLEIKIVTNRLGRGEFEAAQELLDQMYASAEADYQRTVLDMLQADIYYCQERLEEAASLYEALLEDAGPGMSTQSGEFIKQRHARIKDRLGVKNTEQPATV
jgi:tetratricopeptide (TPR) repeat protein